MYSLFPLVSFHVAPIILIQGLCGCKPVATRFPYLDVSFLFQAALHSLTLTFSFVQLDFSLSLDILLRTPKIYYSSPFYGPRPSSFVFSHEINIMSFQQVAACRKGFCQEHMIMTGREKERGVLSHSPLQHQCKLIAISPESTGREFHLNITEQNIPEACHQNQTIYGVVVLPPSQNIQSDYGRLFSRQVVKRGFVRKI